MHMKFLLETRKGEIWYVRAARDGIIILKGILNL